MHGTTFEWHDPDHGVVPLGVHVVALPLRFSFRGIRRRTAVLLEGPGGWGEFCPFVEYDDGVAVPWLRSGLEAALRAPDAGLMRRARVAVNATVPAVGADDVPAVLARFPGCREVKVKVAERATRATNPAAARAAEVADAAADLPRLAAVREALGPGARLRIDVNAAWDLPTALRRLPEYDRAAGGLAYAEQPCRSVEDLVALRRATGVPIAADESFRRFGQTREALAAGILDVAVLKVPPLGGASALRGLAARCRDAGLAVVVSSALETSIGLADAVLAAASLPELPHACGLGTARLFTGDVVDGPLAPTGSAGAIEVSAALRLRRCGPDAARLAAASSAVEAAERGWWLDRLRRVAALASTQDSRPERG